MDSQELISRLKFITKIQKGSKINVPNLYTQEDSWKTTISRSLIYPDSRQSALNFLKETITNCFEMIFLYLKTNNIAKMELVKNIIKDIQLAKIGINNIKYTYRNDTMCVCALETLKEKIDAQLLELKSQYPELMKDFEIKNEE